MDLIVFEGVWLTDVLLLHAPKNREQQTNQKNTLKSFI